MSSFCCFFASSIICDPAIIFSSIFFSFYISLYCFVFAFSWSSSLFFS
jgi:hypothetical protein